MCSCRVFFDVQLKRYDWTRVLSITPRRCYWSGDIIWPFTYAMVSSYAERRKMKNSAIVQPASDNWPSKYISMSSYVYLRLLGKI